MHLIEAPAHKHGHLRASWWVRVISSMAFDTGGLDRCPWPWRPLGRLWCFLSWAMSSAVFLGLMRLFGGPTSFDANESFYSTWAIAHGDFACTYSPSTKLHFLPLFQPGPPIPPVWPLLSGGLSALLGIGHQVPFPSPHSLGPHCSTAFYAMYQWAGPRHPLLPTVGLGYVSWAIVAAGAVSFLRACGRGRCLGESIALLLLACAPPMLMPLLTEYHPQDFLCVGFSLMGMALAKRDRWFLAGLLVGLAMMSQQFALLVFIPMFIISSRDRRWRFVAGSATMAILVALPLIVVTSGRAIAAIALGSGDFRSFGGTLVWEMHLHRAPLVLVTRVLPLLMSLLLALWTRRRLGPAALEPVPLIALIATSLSMRLVFEENLFGYYFMALMVALVLLDILGGKIRGVLLAWIASISLAYNTIPFGNSPNGVPAGHEMAGVLRLAILAGGLLIILRLRLSGRTCWSLIVWFVLAMLAFCDWPPWKVLPLRPMHPIWILQLAIVTWGVALAVIPLWTAAHDRPHSTLRSANKPTPPNARQPLK
jgi:hypothetical protein